MQGPQLAEARIVERSGRPKCASKWPLMGLQKSFCRGIRRQKAVVQELQIEDNHFVVGHPWKPPHPF